MTYTLILHSVELQTAVESEQALSNLASLVTQDETLSKNLSDALNGSSYFRLDITHTLVNIAHKLVAKTPFPVQSCTLLFALESRPDTGILRVRFRISTPYLFQIGPAYGTEFRDCTDNNTLEQLMSEVRARLTGVKTSDVTVNRIMLDIQHLAETRPDLRRTLLLQLHSQVGQLIRSLDTQS